MTPDAILEQHERACERLHATLLSENQIVKRSSEFPDQGLLQEKEAAIQALKDSLGLLRQISKIEDALRPRSESCNAKLMQIIYLAKENEQLLLALTRPPRSDVAPKPASGAHLKRTYGAN